MFKSLKFVAPASLVVLGLFLVGCASTGGAADASDHAVMCPKCETVWVRESKGFTGPRNIHRFSYKAEMTCPTCDKMAKAYFEDDKAVLHDCPDCKVTPKVLAPRKPISHVGHKHQ